MASFLQPSLTVELNLQDTFFVHASSGSSSCPIRVDTWQQWVKTWLETLSPKIPQADSYELTLRLTDDLEIQTLNAQYRQKDEPTDVLAFAALEVDIPQPSEVAVCPEPLYLGDIIISVETATRVAQQQKHPLKHELAWIASHGFLHLLGWDHPDEDSLREMLVQQETLLKLVGLEAQGR